MKNDLNDRTRKFALRVIRMYIQLPKTPVAQVIGTQVLRSGTSIAAKYREACRARSPDECSSKMEIVEQKVDETLLWMELLVDADVVQQQQMADLIEETSDLLKVTVSEVTQQRKDGTGNPS